MLQSTFSTNVVNNRFATLFLSYQVYDRLLIKPIIARSIAVFDK